MVKAGWMRALTDRMVGWYWAWKWRRWSSLGHRRDDPPA